MIQHIALSFVAASLAAAPAAAQMNVWTVAPSGADFTEIQAAVDAASDGDVILVGPGSYAPVHVVGKGLRIHGTSASILNLESAGPPETFIVEGTSASQNFVLEGVTVFQFHAGTGNAMRIQDCAGPVWLQEVFVDAFGVNALHVEASQSVVLDRCMLQTNLSTPGPLGEPQPEPGAFIAGGSRVYAYDTDFRGSHGVLHGGTIAPLIAPQDGGAGIVLVDSEAHLMGGGLFAGFGGQFQTATCLTSADGGDGAELMTAGGAPPRLVLTDVSIIPGTTSFHTPGCGTPVPGQALDVQAGVAIDTLLPERLVAAAEGAPIAGSDVHLMVFAQPGDFFLWFASAAPMPALTLDLPAPAGELDVHLTLSPLVLVRATAIAAFGTALTVPTPALPPGVPAMTAALQGFFIDAFGVPHSSTPHALTLLP